MARVGRRGKGSKISVVVEAHGLPIGVELGSGNENDVTLVEPVLNKALYHMPKPHHLLGDGEYSSKPLMISLRHRYHIIFTAPPRSHYVHFFHDARSLRRKKSAGKSSDALVGLEEKNVWSVDGKENLKTILAS